MYHISNDKRSRKSAELIWQGMKQCLQEKGFDKLRINDICQKSYVSRATFYRLFDSLQDVLAYECDQIYKQLAEAVQSTSIKSKQEFFCLLVKKWMDQEILIKTLVENNMISIIYETHMKHRRFMEKIFLKNIAVSDEEADYMVSLLANIIPAAMNVWYLHKKTETSEDVYRIVGHSLNLIGRQLFCSAHNK